MDSLTAKLYKSPKTVLTNRDLALIWEIKDRSELHAKTAYYVKQKILIRLTRGVFVKDKDYDPKELATSIYIPSYITFETVLRESGIIFQHYDSIFVASKWPKTLTLDGRTFRFRKLKDSVLFNPKGVIINDHYSIAIKERAFLDILYLFPDYYFDNLRGIDWEECEKMVDLYDNKELKKRFDKYKKEYAE